MKVLEGEVIARPGSGKCNWTQLDANLNCGRLASPKRSYRTPQRIELRTLALMGGWASNARKFLISSPTFRKPLISKLRFMQVVDFSDIFRYLRIFSMLFCKWGKHAWRVAYGAGYEPSAITRWETSAMTHARPENEMVKSLVKQSLVFCRRT